MTLADRARQLRSIANREFQTVLRTRYLHLLTVGYAIAVVGFAYGGGESGYLPLVLDLVTPMELLVPALALAFGYRAIYGDRQRGELAVIRTYPVSRVDFSLGVYLGRVTALLAAVLAPLGAVVIARPFVASDPISVLATHQTVDSPAFALRFILLTAAFAVVALGIALALSAVARSSRGAIALALVLVVALAIGFDVTAVAALAGGLVGPDQLATLLALSPSSAYRGLVFSLAVGQAGAWGDPAGLDPLVAAGGLAVWLVGTLGVTIRTVWR